LKRQKKGAEEFNQTNKKEGIQHIKTKLGESLKKKWESKVMHGQKYIMHTEG
jgi:hypothetical protein